MQARHCTTGSWCNLRSQKLLQVIKDNFMTALLNFIERSASKLSLRTGHSKWHLMRRMDDHPFSLGLVGAGREIVFLYCTVFIMCAMYFIAIKLL